MAGLIETKGDGRLDAVVGISHGRFGGFCA